MPLRRRRSLSAVLGALGVAATLVACTASSDKKPDEQAAQAYLANYAKGDVAAAAAGTTDATAASAALKATLDGLGAATKPTFTVTSMSERKSSTATAHYSARWALPGTTAKWQYEGTLPMAKTGNVWRVSWVVADVAPQLGAAQHLVLTRTQPTRAAINDNAGLALFTQQPVVDVTIDPSKVTNLTTLAAALASALDLSAADIVTTVKATPAGQAAYVVTLRRAAYEAVKPKIYSLPGTQFAARTQLLAPTARFAQPLLGQVGEATKEIIDGSKGLVAAGDQTGLSGLQRALNTQLAGTSGYSVQAARDADGVIAGTVAKLSDPVPGRPVTLTLDRKAQLAADAALADVTLPASIVVTQPSTGKILAVANSAAATDDIALVGQFPPGSTFKISTYTAAFTGNAALAPTSTASCPGTLLVNGQTVQNEDKFVLGTVPLTSAFAFSCNTTAAALGLKVPAGGLVAAAKSLGLGANWSLPVDAFSGTFPAPTTPNETAAAAYGQGKVLVSPLLMAEMAGAAATGKTIAPSLVAGSPGVAGATRPATITAYLNTLMRDVVTVDGATGRDLATLPGAVEGKTGTAEFGTAVPARSHSWFAGVRGDLAFSFFIYGGEKSSTGAVPLAKQFLTAYPA